MNGNNIIFFDSFEGEHIPNKIKKFIGDKNIITNIYRIQSYDLLMWGNFCIEFIDFIFRGKSLLDYTDSFPTNDYEKNYKIMLKFSQ